MKAENTTKIQFDSLSVNEAYARGAAAAFLARYDPTVPQLADLKTAVSEAVTNCIVHAYPDRVGPITMTVSVYPGRVVRIVIAERWSRSSPPATRRSAPVSVLRSCRALWIKSVCAPLPAGAPGSF